MTFAGGTRPGSEHVTPSAVPETGALNVTLRTPLRAASGDPLSGLAQAQAANAHPAQQNVSSKSSTHAVPDSGSTPSANKPVMVPRDDVQNILDLITAVAATKDRSEAVSVIVDRLANHFPAASIRAGLGAKQLSRLYDRKLGWLGSESSLFQDAQAHWNPSVDGQLPADTQASGTQAADSQTPDTQAADSQTPDSQTPDSQTRDSQTAGTQKSLAESDSHPFIVCLEQSGGAGRCQIWLSGERRPPHWLSAAATALQTVLWDRPVRSWLRTPERIRQISTLWIGAVVVVLCVVAIWPMSYRIKCTAVVQPARQRLVAAPFEATLLESKVRPGDHVRQGDLLVLLDGRTLRIELESVQSEIQNFEKQNDISLANGRIAEAQQAALSKRKLVRRSQLLIDRLDRLEVVSPIDGVIVSGDLDRFIGSPLETGQTLVEVAPLDRVNIEIEIPEYEIGYVGDRADARIRFASIGGHSIREKLNAVYPAAEIRDDNSVFVAKLEVDNPDGKLRPGMRGDATTYGPVRPASWSWIRGSWERLLWWAGY